ncbi:hypothetical protein Q8F55_003234 [Vanrija albida]|uniref:Amino acid transporter transmembrane domain-containing protein n=1 Tax=Vanrija albida TaxID=181172 RepID=A0ABR3QBX3_9TREE
MSYNPEKMDKADAYVKVVHAEKDVEVVDAVFGEIHDKGGPNYRNVGWLGTTVLMSKATIGIGVLGIPFSLQVVGLIPGLIYLTAVMTIITWSNAVLGQFKRNHPEVYSIADAGRVIGGRAGYEFFFAAFLIYMVFCCGSSIVTIATALNAVSLHGACTSVFIAVASVVGFLASSVRTLGKMAWLGWVGMVTIMAAILTLTIAVTVQSRPSAAPQTGPWDKDFHITRHATFTQTMSAIAAFIFATNNPPTFFGFVSEMRDFRLYDRAMYTTQIFVWCTYMTIGTVVYVYCGQYVAIPALGSAGMLMKRVCYGLGMPGMIVTLAIYSHLAAKSLFVRILHGSHHLNTNTPTHWFTWLGCTLGLTIAEYIIASAIPIFGSLVSLIGALFCPIVGIIPFGVMWYWDNWRTVPADRRTPLRRLKLAWAMAVTTIGCFILVAGTYAAVLDIKANSSKSKPWGCADNSNSVVE